MARRRILANPVELAHAVANVIDNEESACALRPVTPQDVVDARRLVRFNIVWELVHDHTAGYEEIESP